MAATTTYGEQHVPEEARRSGCTLGRADLPLRRREFSQRTHFTLTVGTDLTYYFQSAADPGR